MATKKYLDQQGLQTLIQGLKAKNDILYAAAGHAHAASEISYKNANIKNGADIKVDEALDVLVANIVKNTEQISTTTHNMKDLDEAIKALQAQIGEGTVADKIQAVQTALDNFKTAQATKDQAQDTAIKAAQQAADDAAAAVETEKSRAEGVEQGLQNAIDGMKDAQNGILAQAKSYADQKDGELHTAISAEIDADVKVVADNLTAEISRAQNAEQGLANRLVVVEGEGEGSIKKALADAKTYADGKDAAIAAAKKAGDDAQKDVDALELKVGTVPADKTVIGLISEAKAQADKGVSDASAEATRAKGVEAELRTDLGEKGAAADAEGSAFARIAQIKADLVAEAATARAAEKEAKDAAVAAQGDVDALEVKVGNSTDTADDATVYGAIAAEKARAVAAEEAVDEKAEANKSAIATLNGNDTVEGSVDKKIKTAIDQVNTAAAGLGDRVGVLEGKVGSDADAAKADGTLYARVKQNVADINAIEADYLKTADKTELANAIKAEKDRMDAFMADADVSAQAVDTLKEIQQYITKDGQAATEMVNRIGANETAIAAINNETTGILVQAKKYAEDQDAAQKEALEGAIATAKQGAIESAAATAESKVNDAKSELQGKIDLKADQTALEAEVKRATAAEAANKAVLDKLDGGINDDGSVKKQIETVRAALQANINAKVAQADYDVKVAALEAADTALDGRLDTIEGEGEGSIKKALADAKKYTDNQIDAMALTTEEINSMLDGVYRTQA